VEEDGVAGEDAVAEEAAGGDGEADTEVARVDGRGDGVEASIMDVDSVGGGRPAKAVAETVLLDAQRRWMCGWTCAFVVERKRVVSAKRNAMDFMVAG
jgi:hypothetical protein